MAFQIFSHSLKMVFGQLADALRISGLLFLVTAIVYAAVLYLLFRAQTAEPGSAPFWQMWAAMLLSSGFYMWTAVAWHRFVLMDETGNSPIPPFNWERFLAYLGRALQLGLILLLSFLPAMLVSFIFAMATNGSPIVLVFPLIGAVVSLVVFYRYSPVLPGAAIGHRLGLAEAWAATRGSTGTMFGLVVITMIAAFIIDLPAQLLAPLPIGGVLVVLWWFVTGWIKLIVSLSIITTLFGVYVEKRSIV